MKDDVIDIKIEQAFRANPWYGIISIEEAIEDARAYRHSLGMDDRRLYDEQIELGRHPISAMETVEIVSGRQQPQGHERVPEPV